MARKNTLMQAAGKVKVQTPQISKCCSEENGIQVSRNKNCMPSVYVHMYYPIVKRLGFAMLLCLVGDSSFVVSV